MKRVLFWPSSTILLLGVLALPACGPQDSPEAVIADCSGHIPREQVGHCLERAHAIGQAYMSPRFQSLMAELERRAMRHQMARRNARGYAPTRRPHGHRDIPPDGYEMAQGTMMEEGPPPETRMAEEAPDQSALGYDMPPDDGAQGPPPDEIRPPDDSETQGPEQ